LSKRGVVVPAVLRFSFDYWRTELGSGDEAYLTDLSKKIDEIIAMK